MHMHQLIRRNNANADGQFSSFPLPILLCAIRSWESMEFFFVMVFYVKCSLNHKKGVEVANNAAINYYCCKEDNKTRKGSFSWFITQVFSSPSIFTFFRVSLYICFWLLLLLYNRKRFLIKRRLLGRYYFDEKVELSKPYNKREVQIDNIQILIYTMPYYSNNSNSSCTAKL